MKSLVDDDAVTDAVDVGSHFHSSVPPEDGVGIRPEKIAAVRFVGVAGIPARRRFVGDSKHETQLLTLLVRLGTAVQPEEKGSAGTSPQPKNAGQLVREDVLHILSPRLRGWKWAVLLAGLATPE